MTIERAIEILDPEHRENYESIEPVNDACRMGMEALEKEIPMKPGHFGSVNDWIEDLYCPRCGNYYDIYNAVKMPNKRCGACGQAIDWSEYYH